MWCFSTNDFCGCFWSPNPGPSRVELFFLQAQALFCWALSAGRSRGNISNQFAHSDVVKHSSHTHTQYRITKLSRQSVRRRCKVPRSASEQFRKQTPVANNLISPQFHFIDFGLDPYVRAFASRLFRLNYPKRRAAQSGTYDKSRDLSFIYYRDRSALRVRHFWRSIKTRKTTKKNARKRNQQQQWYLRFRRPSRTLYTKSWNAKSTAGLCGRCVNVFGCAGTICSRIAPLFLFSSNKALLQSFSAILRSIFVRFRSGSQSALASMFDTASSDELNCGRWTYVYNCCQLVSSIVV